MKKPIKIMHIDGNWRIVYIIIRAGGLIKSGVPLKTAIDLLKKEHFDLIISEPHQKAVLTPRAATDGGRPEQAILRPQRSRSSGFKLDERPEAPGGLTLGLPRLT